MEVIPAIDLKGGRCVRLYQGDFDQETVFSDDPLATALSWQEQGGRRLHLVDLDGAVQGKPAHLDVITSIVRGLDIPVQVGGGIRDLAAAEALLNAGVDRVVIGTAAVRDPDMVPTTTRGLWGGVFECKDGRYIRFGGTGNQNFRQFVEAAGITSWDAEGLTDFDRLMQNRELADEAAARSKELFKTRTAQEWEDLVAEAGSEGAMCRTSEEWFEHEHARQSHMVIEVDDPTYGKMLQPGIASACR